MLSLPAAAIDSIAPDAKPIPALASSFRPNALLTVDQNRTTVVDHVVAAWGDALVHSGAGLTKDQLQALLAGLRSDQLLAASLAGSLDGLRNVIANALTANAPIAKGLIQTKALGDATDDLVYTPVVPCRLADSRTVAGGPGPIAANATRNYKVFGAGGTFTPQGGDPGTCGIPANPAAVVLNITAVTPAGTGNLIAFPTGAALPNSSVLNYTAATFALANGAIVPSCVPNCTNQVSIKANGPTVDVVIDIVGYFKPPGDATGLNILVNGQRAMRYEYNAISPNVIGGNPVNNVLAGVRGATIAGGGVPSGDSDPDYASEGPNQVTDHYGTVGGGYANLAGNNNFDPADAPFATVGGGRVNAAQASAATVGGGRENQANGANATIGGGFANQATGPNDVIGGGLSNAANGFSSTVAGGQSNWASDNYSTVAGGLGNAASGLYSTVAGGQGSFAIGNYSIVAGGLFNTAVGAVSFAAGRSANANYDGCFVWGDSSTSNEVLCNAANRFVVRSLGGVYMFTGGTTNQNFTGVSLLPGAQAWTATSDRAGKDNLAAVDAREVLRGVAAMPIATWNWKSQDASIRHMGPMAQDFRAAFGLGETEKGISTVDADGVALAAIQGLNAKVEDQQREIAELRRAVEILMARSSPEGRLVQAR